MDHHQQSRSWNRVICACLLVLTFVAVTTDPAGATQPGKNGRIAFVRDGDIYTALADGRGLLRLTTFGGGTSRPRWSSDGRELAFQRDGRIWTMSADGSGKTGRWAGRAPSWSPDGTRLAYVALTGTQRCAGVVPGRPTAALFVRDLRGGEPRRLACDESRNFGATTSWHPDGRRVMYVSHWPEDPSWEHCGACSEETSLREVTLGATPTFRQLQVERHVRWDGLDEDMHADYAPDGHRFVVASTYPDDPPGDGYPRRYVWVIDRDGSTFRQLGRDQTVRWPGFSPDGRQVLYTFAALGKDPEIRRVTLGSSAAPVVVLRDAWQSDWQPLP